MNERILNTGVQSFISENLNVDIMAVLLKTSKFEGITPKELAQQIEAKKSSRAKLPTWFQNNKIYYPKKLSIEQASSETTALYKSGIVKGKSLLDVTGGFGVDSYFFSKKIGRVVYCEINAELSKIVRYNFAVLEVSNIEIKNGDGIELLKKTTSTFDWIYLDPSRRSHKGKVFMLSDCLPNVTEHLELLFSKSDHILVKTSPLLDLSLGLTEMHSVREIHVVALENEVKELLWVLEKDFKADPLIKTVNIKKDREECFNFRFSQEKKVVSQFSQPLKYLYEPNAAIMKSGGFKLIGSRLHLKKLHENTHLYTSNDLIHFPGRRFLVQGVIPYNKKAIHKLAISKANVTIRNFPESVATIRKKHRIKDGGSDYLLFVKDLNANHLVIRCKRIF